MFAGVRKELQVELKRFWPKGALAQQEFVRGADLSYTEVQCNIV